MNELQTARSHHLASLLEVTQIALMLAVALLVGACCGYLTSRRGQYRDWALGVAPVAACVVNLGVLALTAWYAPSPDPPSDWPRALAGTVLLAVGVGIVGLVPSILTSWLFQSHCRSPKQGRESPPGP